jgi:hypothetical protein
VICSGVLGGGQAAWCWWRGTRVPACPGCSETPPTTQRSWAFRWPRGGGPLGQAIPFFALRAALREPFARLTADDPGRAPPDATAWWITQIRAYLEQRAAAAPVLVCLDDLHWASPATLAALRTLPRDLKRHPVAWLLARSSTPHRATGYLFGQLEQDGAARLTLGPLDQDAVAAMLTDAFGAPPDQALANLACGAAGNPRSWPS